MKEAIGQFSVNQAGRLKVSQILISFFVRRELLAGFLVLPTCLGFSVSFLFVSPVPVPTNISATSAAPDTAAVEDTR